MPRRLFLLSSFLALLVLGAWPAPAAQKQIGKPCKGDSAAFDWDALSQCDGTTFIKGPLALGAVQAPPYASANCSAEKAGMLQWTGTSFQGCNGSQWVPFGGSPWLQNESSLYYNSGNVGIGTQNPSYPLDVNGPMNATPITARIYQTVNQSIPNSVWTKLVNLAGVSFDTGAMADTAQSRLVIKHAGYYSITGSVRWNTPAGTILLGVWVWINGQGSCALHEYLPSSYSPATAQASCLVHMNAGDFLELYVIQGTGAALSTAIGSTTGPSLSVVRLN